MIVLMRVMLNVIHGAIDQMNFAMVTKDALVILRQIVVSYHLSSDMRIYTYVHTHTHTYIYIYICNIHYVYTLCYGCPTNHTLLVVPKKPLVCTVHSFKICLIVGNMLLVQ